MGEWSEGYELFWFYTATIGNFGFTLLFVGLVLMHGRNVYLDFYTSERLSVSHRRRAPEITKPYKLVGLATMLNGIIGVLLNISVVLNQLSSTNELCNGSILSSFAFGLGAKFCVYCVFGLRLHMVYNGSQYATSVGRLKLLIGLIFAWSIFLGIWTLAQIAEVLNSEDTNDSDESVVKDDNDWTGFEWVVTYDDEGAINNVCIINTGLTWIICWALFDIGCNVYYCVKFVLPIRQVIRLVQGSSRNVMEKSKLERKMLFVGFKVMLLSAVLFASTIIITTLFAGVITPVTNMGPCDYCINFICLALMTPYYPDSKYYRVACKCCLFCCDRYGVSEKDENAIELEAQSPRNDEEPTENPTVFSATDDTHNLSKNDQSDIAPSANAISVDTMSAVRIGADQEAPMTKQSETPNVETEMASNLGP